MSVRKAQKIVNSVDTELGINLVAYQLSELQWLKARLEEFIDLDIDTEELADSEDEVLFDEDLEEEEYEDEEE